MQTTETTITQHTPKSRPRCVSKTTKGKPCKAYQQPHSPFCWSHEWYGLAEALGGPLDGWMIPRRSICVGRVLIGRARCGRPVLLGEVSGDPDAPLQHTRGLVGMYRFRYIDPDFCPVWQWTTVA
jgi:hypothetical protein